MRGNVTNLELSAICSQKLLSTSIEETKVYELDINDKARAVVQPLLEESEHVVWLGKPEERHSWIGFIPICLFFMMWLGFNIFMFSASPVISILFMAVGAYVGRVILISILSKQHEVYTLTNKRGLIVTDFESKRFKFLKLECRSNVSLGRGALRSLKGNRTTGIGTLAFEKWSPIEFGDIPSTSPLRKFRTLDRYEFRNIRNPSLVIDLIQLHFFGNPRKD